MFRLLGSAGIWHRSAHLEASKWQNFEFNKDWKNLVMMHNLRKYYIDISPPFSRYAAPRVVEMEKLDDDLAYYHIKRSIYHFMAWIVFVMFILDWDAFEMPNRFWRQDAQPQHDMIKIRQTYMRDDK